MSKNVARNWLKSEIVIDYDRAQVSERQFKRDVRERLDNIKGVPLNGLAPGYRLYLASDGDDSTYILTKDNEVVSAMRYYDYGADLMAESIAGLCLPACLYQE